MQATSRRKSTLKLLLIKLYYMVRCAAGSQIRTLHPNLQGRPTSYYCSVFEYFTTNNILKTALYNYSLWRFYHKHNYTRKTLWECSDSSITYNKIMHIYIYEDKISLLIFLTQSGPIGTLCIST